MKRHVQLLQSLALVALVTAALVAGIAATTAPAANTTSVAGTVFVDGNGNGRMDHGETPLYGAVVWLRVPDGKGGYTSDKYSYPIQPAHGYTFSLTAGSWQLHVVPPAGYSVVGDNPLTVQTTDGHPIAGLNFAAVKGQVATPTGNPVVTPPAVQPPPVVVPPVVVLPPPVVPVTPPATGPPATAPATPPAGLPGIACGYGAAKGPASLYTVRAGSAARFDLSARVGTRPDRLAWHTAARYGQLPDPRHVLDPVRYPTPTIVADDVLTATSVGVVYDVPGDYSLTCAVTHADGSATTYAQAVRVLPDARPVLYFSPAGNDANAGTAASPKLSWAAMSDAARKGNVRVVVAGDLADMVKPGGGTGLVTLGPGATVEGVPAADGTLPAVYGCPWVYFDASGAGSAVRRLNLTARSAAVAGNGVVVHGDGVLVDGCLFGRLVRAVDVESGDGVTVVRNVQPDATTIQSQVVSAWGGTNLTVAFNSLLGSTKESTLRIDGGHAAKAGTATGVERNYIAANLKATVDLRTADGLVLANNAIANGQVATTSIWAATATTPAGCRDILFTGDAYRWSGKTDASEAISIHGYSNGVTVDGEDIVGPAGFCDVSVVTMATPVDVAVANMKLSGGMKPGWRPAGLTPITIPMSATPAGAR